jgi:hypothetical protein
LRWEDIEGDVIRLRAENAKNDEARSVVLTGGLAELIARRKIAREVKTTSGVMLAAHVFHNHGLPVANFRKSWQTACVAAGVGQFICPICKQSANGHKCSECKSETRYSGSIFHDLRRTAVRNMIRSGVLERVAMDISGHKTRSIFDRYNITSESDLRDAMTRLQDHLAANAERQQKPVAIRQAAGSKN